MIEQSNISNKRPLNSMVFIFWAVLLFSMIARYTYFGLEYFPVLDDHNMYGYILKRYSPEKAFIILATSRPAACFFDCFIISRLWQDMWVVLMAITVLHWFCCILLYEIFRMLNLSIGCFSILFFALAPFSTEATYWISASSRLVIGLFFSLASIYILVVCVTRQGIMGSKKLLSFYALFWLVNLLSMGFYEQITVVSFIIPILILAVFCKKLKYKWVIVLPLLNTSIFALYYLHFSDVGQIASRGQLISGHYLYHTENVFKNIRHLVFSEQWLMIRNGAARGLEIVSRSGLWLMMMSVAVVILSVCCSKNQKIIHDPNKALVIKLVLSVFLFILPFAPFFVIENTYIANRNVFLSLFAIGLLAETLLGAAFKWDRMKIGIAVISGVMCAAFLLANISEINDYKNVSMIDREIAANVANAYAQDDENGEDGALLFNAEDLYTEVTQRHFSNCTAADWALTGAVQSLTDAIHIGVVQPVKKGAVGIPITPEKNYSYYGMNDNLEVFRLNGTWRDGDLILMKEDGSLFGTVIRDDKGNQVLELPAPQS